MSDRITIDHIRNTINIHVASKDLSQMKNEDILEWIKSFINNIENLHLKQELAGDYKEETLKE